MASATYRTLPSPYRPMLSPTNRLVGRTAVLKEEPREALSPTGSQSADDELERRLLVGDQAAAEELTRRHYLDTYHALLGWCRNAPEAEDLTQEAYRKAWKSLASFRGQARFSTWMHRIAYTTFLNSRRSSSRMQPLEPSAAEALVAPEPEPEHRSMLTERNRALRRAALDLDEPFRRTVLAHYWQDLTVADLAQAEDITTVAVRKRLDKARRLIARSLEGRGLGVAEGTRTRNHGRDTKAGEGTP